MKAFRIAAFVLGGLLALLIAAGAYVLATFDAARWKGEITELVKEKKGRTLKIDGDLSLSLFPAIAVRLGKATLSEHGSEQVFAAVEDARVSLRLLPLLSKQVVVDTIALDGVKARLVRGKDGRLNIDDLLGKDEPSEPTRFDIAGVKLSNAELAWRDETSGQELALSGLDLATGRLANAANGKLELSAKLAGKQPLLAARLTAMGEYRYDLDRKSYGGTKLDLRLNGDIAELKGLDLALTAAALQFTGVDKLAVDRLLLTAKGKEGGDAFEARLEAPQLALAADKASGAAINATLRLNGARRALDARIALSGVEGSNQSLRADKLALDVDARQDEAALKGRLASALTASLDKRSVELPAIGGALELSHPRMPMKSVRLPFDGGLRADLGGRTAAMHANARLDESRIAARVNISRFSPLALNFDVDIDRLDLDKYLPPKTATGKAASEGGPAQDQPLDFSALKALDASGTLKIGQLQVSNVKAANVRIEVKAASGRLDAAPLSAKLYEGSLQGALSLSAAGNQVTLRQNLANVNINPLLRDALDRDVLEGRGNVALDVTTAGASVRAMKKSLAGTASLSLRDGAIKGINLAKKLRESKAILSARKDAVQQARREEKTDFSELSASFRIARGVARNDDLSMKSPFLRLGGAGDIDLGEERIDYLARASVVASAGGQGGKELEHLKGLTVPVRLSGPFDQLAWNIEFGSLAADAVKARVEEKVREKVGEKVDEKAKGKAGDLLKGLLRN